MANQITQYLAGKNLTFTITPLDVAADGTYSNNALGAVTFAGRLTPDGQGSSFAYQTENVSPLDCGYSNPVDIEQQSTYSISEYQQTAASSATANSLDKIARVCRYFSMVITWKDNTGTPVTKRTETSIVKWIQYDNTYRKGNAVGMMRCMTVAVASAAGVYVANPTLADS